VHGMGLPTQVGASHSQELSTQFASSRKKEHGYGFPMHGPKPSRQQPMPTSMHSSAGRLEHGVGSGPEHSPFVDSQPSSKGQRSICLPLQGSEVPTHVVIDAGGVDVDALPAALLRACAPAAPGVVGAPAENDTDGTEDCGLAAGGVVVTVFLSESPPPHAAAIAINPVAQVDLFTRAPRGWRVDNRLHLNLSWEERSGERV